LLEYPQLEYPQLEYPQLEYPLQACADRTASAGTTIAATHGSLRPTSTRCRRRPAGPARRGLQSRAVALSLSQPAHGPRRFAAMMMMMMIAVLERPCACLKALCASRMAAWQRASAAHGSIGGFASHAVGDSALRTSSTSTSISSSSRSRMPPSARPTGGGGSTSLMRASRFVRDGVYL
jgi:hypothetical protein